MTDIADAFAYAVAAAFNVHMANGTHSAGFAEQAKMQQAAAQFQYEQMLRARAESEHPIIDGECVELTNQHLLTSS